LRSDIFAPLFEVSALALHPSAERYRAKDHDDGGQDREYIDRHTRIRSHLWEMLSDAWNVILNLENVSGIQAYPSWAVLGVARGARSVEHRK
jgi:hypothetical protein